MRVELRALGVNDIDRAALGKIYQAHVRRFPGLNYSDRVVALSGAYCRDIAETLPNRGAVLNQQLAFMNALGEVAGGGSEQGDVERH